MKKVLLLLLVLAVALPCLAQTSTNAVTAVPAKMKFAPVPNVPDCAKAAVLHGDPFKTEFVLLIRASAKCTVPNHWHTANEQLGMVSGTGSVKMKDEGSATSLPAGAYAYLPSKHAHSFRCPVACSFFLGSDGAFDIHYVDDAGQEITPEQALKSKAAGKAKEKGAAAEKTTTTKTTTTKTTTEKKK